MSSFEALALLAPLPSGEEARGRAPLPQTAHEPAVSSAATRAACRKDRLKRRAVAATAAKACLKHLCGEAVPSWAAERHLVEHLGKKEPRGLESRSHSCSLSFRLL